MTEAVERFGALLRCGHVKECTELVNVGDSFDCEECGGESRKVWLTPGVHKYHCLSCKSATRSLIPAVIRGQAAQHAYRNGHVTVYYVEGRESEAERIEDTAHGSSHATTATARRTGT